MSLIQVSGGSSNRALVRGQVELQGFLCRGVFVQTKDMSQECQTPSFYSFSDGYLFCDVVEFLTADDLWVLYIQCDSKKSSVETVEGLFESLG